MVEPQDQLQDINVSRSKYHTPVTQRGQSAPQFVEQHAVCDGVLLVHLQIRSENDNKQSGHTS